MFGGNDSNNMLVPTDTARYQNYSTKRGALALPRLQLLPISPEEWRKLRSASEYDQPAAIIYDGREGAVNASAGAGMQRRHADRAL